MTGAISLGEPLPIGSLRVPNRVLLAPLAGVSDIPFRRICQELGAGLTFVEMLSATAIRYHARRTTQMLKRHPGERHLGVQVTAANPGDIAEAIRIIEAHAFDCVDINMGCPVRKVVGKGCGSALLKDPDNVEAIVRRVRETTSRPVTVKVRLGWTARTINIEETARAAARAGAMGLTIHGRTRADTYAVRVNYDGIRRGCEAARAAAAGPIVLVGNGDLMNLASAHEMVRRTGCDALMVSRGALGNPWIFRQLVHGRDEQPTVEEWRDVALRHIDYHAAHYAHYHGGAILFRKHLLWYINGFPGARRERNNANVVSSMEEAGAVVRRFADNLPRGLRRYDDKAASLLTRPAPEHDPKCEMDREWDRGVAAGE